MNINLQENYKKINDILGLPQEYKGIKFYPIKMGEVDYKSSLYNLFYYPKNYIPDVSIIKMSYIKYLLFRVNLLLQQNDPSVNLYHEFINFICHITHNNKPSIEDMDNGIGSVHFINMLDHPEKEDIEQYTISLFINNIQFSESDIDNIREIILEQNGSSIEWVEDYKPDLEERLNVFNNNNDIDLKDVIYSFCALTNLSEKEVCEKTIFQFNARLEREMKLKDYQAFKPLEISGQVTAKNKNEELFKHYLSHIPMKGRYDDILLNLNTFMENSGLNNPESGLKNGTNFE